MEAPVDVHPSPDTLQAFGLGKLDDILARAVIDHLAGCLACSKAGAAQSGDDFLARLRDAHRPGSTPVPVKLAASSPPPSTSLPPQPAAALVDVPPELAADTHYEVVR